MIVYFGTAMREADMLRARGLHPHVFVDEEPPKVSTSEAWAAGAAAHGVTRALIDDPASDTLGLMLVMDLSPDRLRQDPRHWHLHELVTGCDPGEILEWRRFDASPGIAPIDDPRPVPRDELRGLTLEQIHALRWTGRLGVPPDDELLGMRSTAGVKRRRKLRAAVPRDVSALTRQADALQRDLIRKRVTCREGHETDWPDMLGRGNSRLVIALDDRFAAKVSWPVHALGGFAVQNMTEAAVWELADEPTRDWLAPVVAVGASGAIVQMRGEPLERADRTYPTGALAHALRRRLSLCTERLDWVDFGGDPVLCDYANRVARRRPGVLELVRDRLTRIEHTDPAALLSAA